MQYYIYNVYTYDTNIIGQKLYSKIGIAFNYNDEMHVNLFAIPINGNLIIKKEKINQPKISNKEKLFIGPICGHCESTEHLGVDCPKRPPMINGMRGDYFYKGNVGKDFL